MAPKCRNRCLPPLTLCPRGGVIGGGGGRADGRDAWHRACVGRRLASVLVAHDDRDDGDTACLPWPSVTWFASLPGSLADNLQPGAAVSLDRRSLLGSK